MTQHSLNSDLSHLPGQAPILTHTRSSTGELDRLSASVGGDQPARRLANVAFYNVSPLIYHPMYTAWLWLDQEDWQIGIHTLNGNAGILEVRDQQLCLSDGAGRHLHTLPFEGQLLKAVGRAAQELYVEHHSALRCQICGRPNSWTNLRHLTTIINPITLRCQTCDCDHHAELWDEAHD